MARSTKIVGFSLPPEVYRQLEKFAKTRHKTRSEFIREMIDTYGQAAEKLPSRETEAEPIDLARVLKTYWLLKKQLPLSVILLGLGIIVNKKGEVLIGARNEKDRWVKNLTWCFPGGRLESLDFEKILKAKIKAKTGLDVRISTLVTSRIHPDAGFKDIQVVALYFFCEPIDGKQKPGVDFYQLKWVKPSDVFKYFATSTSDEVTKFLMSLES